MSEPTIVCPTCKTQIKLTESLAAPLLAATKQEYEQKLTAKDTEIEDREAAVKDREAEIEKANAAINQTVAEKVNAERITIAADEAKKARQAVSDEIAKTKDEKEAAEELVKDRDEKLAQARKNELQLRKERQALQEEKEQFELDKQKAIDEERTSIREAAQKDADEQSRLKMAEKDKTISDLQTKLQEALRKAEQGSQQLQGEVLELALEGLLRAKFPTDSIEPVPKGEFGGDCVHRVMGPLGKQCGSILWESKRTKAWSDGWLVKLKDNQRTAKAEIAIIVSVALPKGTDSFDLVDGVWVTSPQTAIALACAIRNSLVELAGARAASDGQQTKMELVYQYLTGPQFRHRVQAIVEKFADMQADLEKERKAMTKAWAKREQQIRGVIESTAGMYGDLQGIAGRSLQEIEGLDMKALEASQLDD